LKIEGSTWKYTTGKQDCEPPMAVSFVTRLRPVLVNRRGDSRRKRRRKKKTKEETVE